MARRTHRQVQPWTSEEDERMGELAEKVDGVAFVPLKWWHMVAASLGTGRRASDCRQRWELELRKRFRKLGAWTVTENVMIACLHAHVQGGWSRMADYLLFRTQLDIKNHVKTPEKSERLPRVPAVNLLEAYIKRLRELGKTNHLSALMTAFSAFPYELEATEEDRTTWLAQMECLSRQCQQQGQQALQLEAIQMLDLGDGPEDLLAAMVRLASRLQGQTRLHSAASAASGAVTAGDEAGAAAAAHSPATTGGVLHDPGSMSMDFDSQGQHHQQQHHKHRGEEQLMLLGEAGEDADGAAQGQQQAPTQWELLGNGMLAPCQQQQQDCPMEGTATGSRPLQCRTRRRDLPEPSSGPACHSAPCQQRQQAQHGSPLLLWQPSTAALIDDPRPGPLKLEADAPMSGHFGSQLGSSHSHRPCDSAFMLPLPGADAGPHDAFMLPPPAPNAPALRDPSCEPGRLPRAASAAIACAGTPRGAACAGSPRAQAAPAQDLMQSPSARGRRHRRSRSNTGGVLGCRSHCATPTKHDRSKAAAGGPSLVGRRSMDTARALASPTALFGAAAAAVAAGADHVQHPTTPSCGSGSKRPFEMEHLAGEAGALHGSMGAAEEEGKTPPKRLQPTTLWPAWGSPPAGSWQGTFESTPDLGRELSLLPPPPSISCPGSQDPVHQLPGPHNHQHGGPGTGGHDGSAAAAAMTIAAAAASASAPDLQRPGLPSHLPGHGMVRCNTAASAFCRGQSPQAGLFGGHASAASLGGSCSAVLSRFASEEHPAAGGAGGGGGGAALLPPPLTAAELCGRGSHVEEQGGDAQRSPARAEPPPPFACSPLLLDTPMGSFPDLQALAFCCSTPPPSAAAGALPLAQGEAGAGGLLLDGLDVEFSDAVLAMLANDADMTAVEKMMGASPRM